MCGHENIVAANISLIADLCFVGAASHGPKRSAKTGLPIQKLALNQQHAFPLAVAFQKLLIAAIRWR
jgi:hypothetical protein